MQKFISTLTIYLHKLCTFNSKSQIKYDSRMKKWRMKSEEVKNWRIEEWRMKNEEWRSEEVKNE